MDAHWMNGVCCYEDVKEYLEIYKYILENKNRSPWDV